MKFPYLILLCIICSSSLSALNAQKQKTISQNTSLENRSNGITGPGPWKQLQKHQALRSVHGTVNIIGWGVLLPIGAIIARYMRKVLNDWYTLHISCQLSGFLLGTLGWGLGISIIKNEGKEHSMSTHGILGTVIFALATLQLLAMCLQAEEEEKWRKYWVIYHQLIGYALIALIIANIFEGIKNQSATKKWDCFYGATLGVLSITVLALEVHRWRYAI